MSEPDWAGLWRELVERSGRPDKAGEALERGKEKRPDLLLDFMLEKLQAADTLLDIGAGSGRYAVPFARKVKTVTAIEPSPARAAVLRENGIQVIEGRWEDATVAPHDVAFCSHAMYTSADLVAFVRKMERHARTLRCLVMRMPAHDGVLGELSRRIYGHPHDSPNFWIGYHVLYEMGIYAHVVMEPAVRRWTDESLDAAMSRARRHLQLEDGSRDALIRETLARRLTVQDGNYCWPDGMRSALVWW
ncbi:MAG TPA: methyltransferase domain-containing protein [Burkholderiales bacterium]